MNEVTTSTESATTPRVGTSASQILRTTQSDTWDRPDPMDEDEDEDHERDFAWIAIEPSRNPHLVSASGHKLKHHGEQWVPVKRQDGRKIWITFSVCEVDGPS